MFPDFQTTITFDLVPGEEKKTSGASITRFSKYLLSLLEEYIDASVYFENETPLLFEISDYEGGSFWVRIF